MLGVVCESNCISCLRNLGSLFLFIVFPRALPLLYFYLLLSPSLCVALLIFPSTLKTLTLNIPGVDKLVHPFLFLRFSQKFFPATYDKTLCKFLLYTYENSHNSFWSKILSREHVEYAYVAWVENVNFKDCNFRVLRGIFWGVSIKQKLPKIEKYQVG